MSNSFRTMIRRAALPVFGALALAAHAAPAERGSGYDERPEVREFLAAFAEEQGFSTRSLLRLFSHVKTQNSAIQAMSAPVVAPPKWFEYAPRFLNTERIAGGVTFRNTHRAALERAEREYGVPSEVIVAIIGVETSYGRNIGRYRVLDALATLAFDYPRRADYFREELRQFLLLAREWKISPLEPKGSFAGAMGVPQFMPTSFRRFAVDYDADGKIDLWTGMDDVIGSVANYLSLHGWERDRPVLLPVSVDSAEARAAVGGNGLSERRDYAGWTALNVSLRESAAIDPQWEAMLVQLDEIDGPGYRLGFNNFYVLTRYNRSRMYAAAVWDLALGIRRADLPQ
ncbi:MAG: lytic murein transglycosylase B [Betaproteobacteria bacterium]|nr:lytic murein transglycosylase B [Betaproteobacteria bacterium]